MSLSKFNVRRMTVLALLIAVIVIMSYTPLGYLQIGPLSMSLLTIPVAIAAIVLGPIDGAILGAVFGFTSFFNAMSGKSAMGAALFGISPIGTFVVCVIARILMGFGTGLIYAAVSKAMPKKTKLNCIWAGLSAAVLNTIFFMGFLVLLFYRSAYVQGLVTAMGVSNPLMFVITLVGLQGLIEAIVCSIVSGAVSVPLLKVWKA